MKKQNLPTKVCKVCNKPFSWRKKWKLNWEKLSIALRDAPLVINYCVLLFLGSLSDFKIFDSPVIFKL